MTDRASASDLSDRVSVVLLTFNCAHRLDEVLDHLLELGVPVVAVDNGSADGTADRLRRDGVEVVALPRNIGAAARDVGVGRVRTPYVAFCDDDGWYEPGSLEHAVDLLDDHPRLAVVNARILVGPEHRLDPISAIMARSPLPDRAGIPGPVLLGFMAGAVVVRVAAWREVGGYDPRFFIGGEEETVTYPLAARGWQLRYVPEVIMYHRPSLANVDRLRAYGLRTTLVNAWLHRPVGGALRWSLHVLADRPKNRDWLRGLGMAMLALPWTLAERRVWPAEVEADQRLLDAEHFADRRPFWSRHYGRKPSRVAAEQDPIVEPAGRP